MTKYYSELLKKLRAPKLDDPTPKLDGPKPHHLFLLGTSIKYVKKPTTDTDKSYIRGETFSYVAQVVSYLYKEKGEPLDKNGAHSYRSPSVDVLDGPDTIGSKIARRIGQALLLALGAVAEGKDELHISGFSRGGVEAIMLTHELERVRNQLEVDLKNNTGRSLKDIIGDSSSVSSLIMSDTKAALKKLLGEKDTLLDNAELKQKLFNNLEKIKVHLFVLDPVPGGNFGKIVHVGWQEKNFYTLPCFVVKKHELVQQHETSNGFKPIIPVDMPYEVIPGCHGTGDGNQFDHNGEPVPDKFKHRDLSGVQDLVLRRWYDFTFPEAIILSNKIDLEHPGLDVVSNAYLPAKESERNKQLLENYQCISKNYSAFEWLATRYYKALGQYMPQRMVHYHQRRNTPITDLDIRHGGGFVSHQHVQLWMRNQFSKFNFFEKTLLEQIQWLNHHIKVVLNKDLSNDDEKLLIFVSDDKNHGLLIQSLSVLVNTVVQTYLRNHLSEDKKQACLELVEDTFRELQNVKGSETEDRTRKLAYDINNTIRHDLTEVMLAHHNALLDMTNKLLQEPWGAIECKESQVKEVYDESIESQKLYWLEQAQRFYEDLDLLVQQISGLERWFDQERLLQAWSKMASLDFTENTKKEQDNNEKNLSESTDPTVQLQGYKQKLFKYINERRELLSRRAGVILLEVSAALEKRPEEINKLFYQEIVGHARIKSLEESEQLLKGQMNELTKDLEQERLDHKNTHNLLIQQQTIYQEALAEIQRAKEDNKTLQEEIQKLKKKITLLQAQVEHEQSAHRWTGYRFQQTAEEKNQVEAKVKELDSRCNQLQEALQGKELECKKAQQAQNRLQRNKRLLESNLEQQKQENALLVARLEQQQQQMNNALIETTTLAQQEASVATIQQEHENREQQEEERQRIQERLTQALGSEEWKVRFRVERLRVLCTEYLEHLNKNNDDSELLNQKKTALSNMKRILENDTALPSEQLKDFDTELQNTQDAIKEHRDPMWLRFFRDCLRIIAITVSGVGVCRMLQGKSPAFFNPSHGERFVEKVEQSHNIEVLKF